MAELNADFMNLTIEVKRGKPKPADRKYQLSKFIEYKESLLTAANKWHICSRCSSCCFAAIK